MADYDVQRPCLKGLERIFIRYASDIDEAGKVSSGGLNMDELMRAITLTSDMNGARNPGARVKLTEHIKPTKSS